MTDRPSSSRNRPAGKPRSIDELADHRQVAPGTKTRHHQSSGETGNQSGSLKPARKSPGQLIPSRGVSGLGGMRHKALQHPFAR